MEMSYETLAEFIRANPEKAAIDLLPLAKQHFQTYSTQNVRKFRKYVNKVRNKDKPEVEDLSTPIDVESPTYDQQFRQFGSILTKTKEFVDILDLCNSLNCTPRVLYRIVDEYRAVGKEIVFNNYSLALSKNIVAEVEKKKTPLVDDREIVFGVCSDLHFGSNACQLTALNEFAEKCKKQGVKHMLVPGDILAGHNVYSGQAMDQYAFGADEQEASAIVNLPAGFEWYFLGGNHDYSFIRHSGHNPITVLASKRDDIHYIGYDEADVPLLDGVDAKLWHPSGGVPYSYSYRLQKGVERVTMDELQRVVGDVKPRPTLRFLFSGHLHIQMQGMFGSVMGMQCGCFEGTTNYLRRKGLVPTIGGYIVKATVNGHGLLKDFEARFHMFEEAQDDWRNYRHTLMEGKIEDPILTPISAAA